MHILEKLDRLYRATFGPYVNLKERAVREQDALAEWRRSPGHLTWCDFLDSEQRSRFGKWLDEPDPAKAEVIRIEARTIRWMKDTMEGLVTARERAEKAEQDARRQLELMEVDRVRHRDTMEAALRAQHQGVHS